MSGDVFTGRCPTCATVARLMRNRPGHGSYYGCPEGHAHITADGAWHVRPEDDWAQWRELGLLRPGDAPFKRGPGHTGDE
jgi:hypothetical protein